MNAAYVFEGMDEPPPVNDAGAGMQKRALSSAFLIFWIDGRDYGSMN
jgi:hypothetical protein